MLPSGTEIRIRWSKSVRFGAAECKMYVRRLIRYRGSFALPARFVAVMPEGSAGLGNEFGAPALDEIAGFGDEVLQYFDQFRDAGVAIYKLSS